MKQINIAKPVIGYQEQRAVLEVLKSGQLVQGPRVAEFEERFADYHGAKHGVAVNNGTSALIASMLAHDIGEGDEVIIPAFSFFATASCILSTGATPVFADIDPDTFNMTPESASKLVTPQTKAIMPVHLFGHPANMEGFQALCDHYNLALLEDAAQAHGAGINGRFVGTWGTASFSFYPTKNITTTEGGMVLTNDDYIAKKLRLVRNHGMEGLYQHSTLGYNFRMTDMAAAIGLVQLNRLPGWTVQRNANALYLSEHLEHVITPVVKPGYKHVFHQYTIRVPEPFNRDDVVHWLNSQGIGARVYYPVPIYRQPVIQQRFPQYRDLTLPETERAAAQVISLPVHPSLAQDDLERIVEVVNMIAEIVPAQMPVV
ncbi:MAG: DegT/DnrJ/EryC1/StrS family aminotransferase [Chloroflexi bacterium]|nr:MAG: DegT/DnrJ/EryC1/StrS family aminotransferase [Chloroflexota bacterium]